MKRTGLFAGGLEFTPDGFFDFLLLLAIVKRQHLDGLAGLVAFGDNFCYQTLARFVALYESPLRNSDWYQGVASARCFL